MQPHLEIADQVIRMLGWPTLLGVLVWVVRKWDAGQRDLKAMGDNTKLAVVTVTSVQAEVEQIKTNHLAHLQEGITLVAASNDKAVTLLQNIDASIKILIDRTPRV